VKLVHVSVGAHGALVSTFAPLDVTFVMLQFHAASHTFGVILHVAAAHCVIKHVTGVHDIIPAHVSAYVNVDV